MFVVVACLLLVALYSLLWLFWRNSPEYRACLAAVHAAGDFRRDAREIIGFTSRARQREQAAARAYVADCRTDMRRAWAMEDLKSLGVKNVRWGSLKAAGIRTLDDLHGKSAVELTAIPGVGEASVARVLAGASAATREIEKRAMPMPGALLAQSTSVELVACVARARRAAALPSAHTRELEQQIKELGRCRDAMVAQATVLRWAFAGQERRQEGSIKRAAHVVREAALDARASSEFRELVQGIALIDRQWPERASDAHRLEASVREAYAGLQDPVTAALRAVASSVVDWRTDLSIAPPGE